MRALADLQSKTYYFGDRHAAQRAWGPRGSHVLAEQGVGWYIVTHSRAHI